MAAEIATVYAGEFVAFQRRLLRSRILRARRGIVAEADRLARLQELSDAEEETQADLRRRERNLREREADLTALAAVQTGNARVVQPAAVPGAPSSPKPVRNLIAGIGLGLLLGIGLAVLFHLLDRRLNNPEDIETLFESPTLGAIPRTPALSAKGGKAATLPPSARESFRMLQTQMSYFNDHQPARSVAVISAAPGDGKSTVAWNLAVAGVDAGARVLLVEADLRNPTLASRCEDAVESGLSDVLSSRSELADVVHPVPVGAHGQNGGTTNRMDVVFAGPRPTNPRQLIASRQMRELVSLAEAAYDLVVIDTPPTSIVSDAIPIIRSVGGVLVVTRLRKSTRSEVAHLHEQLRNLDAPTLGIVINGVESSDGYYGAAFESARAYVGDPPCCCHRARSPRTSTAMQTIRRAPDALGLTALAYAAWGRCGAGAAPRWRNSAFIARRPRW